MRTSGTPFHVDVLGPSVLYTGPPHVLSVVRDITERVQARELLEQRVAERTRELSTLLDVSHNVASTLELQPLVGLILDQLKTVVDYTGAALWQLGSDGEALTNLDYRGPLPREEVRQVRFAVGQTGPDHTVIRTRQPLIVDDVRGDSALARAYLAAKGQPRGHSFDYIRSWMGIPLLLKERVIGIMVLVHRQPQYYTPRHATLALAIANQAAVAIENARLYEQTMQRTSELSALLDVSRTVASTLELKPLLNLMLDQLSLVADNDGMTLLELRGDEFVVLLRRAPGPEDQEFPRRYSIQRHGPMWDKLRRGEVVIIGNVREDDALAHAYRQTVGDFLTTSLAFERSFMAVPLMLKDRIIGALGLSSARLDFYTPHHGELTLAIAQQAAIAMENARLYQQAQEVAVLEERQRLSRELHDSVSQALYSVALGIKTGRTWLDRDPQSAAEPLDFALAQAELGLAEMRALIFELRPEALETEGLVAALERQTALLQTRNRISVQADLGEEPNVPLAVKEALYRIAQEALHNAIKHAQARTVEVRLGAGPETLALEVRDDGTGFDTGGAFPGHLGLHTMRERAERLGGTLDVASVAGHGTRIRVHIPNQFSGPDKMYQDEGGL